MKKITFLISLGLFLLLLACQKDQNGETVEPDKKLDIRFVRPANFPEPVYKLEKNPITTDGFLLGKALFYEGEMSLSGMDHCGTCHIQSSAFTQHEHDVSHNLMGKLGKRNSPAIMNLAWMSSFMWDGGIHDLDLQPIAPIESPVEMQESFPNVVKKLQKMPKYPPMFQKAFGTEEITGIKVLQALSQFMLMCVSGNSKYDLYVRKEKNTQLSTDELQGLQIFKQKCAVCHKGELFSDFTFRDNGLKQNLQRDAGRYEITLNETDKGKFKVPSLRNLTYTLPYMHDGRFQTLEQVLDHYTQGVQNNANLDPLLKQNGKLGIDLSETEKKQILAFLRTLDDRDFITDPKLAEY